MKADKILIIADDSLPSIKAIQYGFSLAKEVNADVILMCVIEPSITIGNVDAGIFPDDALSVLKRNTNEFLDRMKIKYARDINTELITAVGDVQTSVTLAAKEHNADMIVTGARSRTGLNRLFKGSVAESIIQHSVVPVLVVPMGK